jgi:hypothetical protein
LAVGYKPLSAPDAVLPDATTSSTAIVAAEEEPVKPGHINFFSDLEQGKVSPAPPLPGACANAPLLGSVKAGEEPRTRR